MLFWDPNFALRQLMRMVPAPKQTAPSLRRTSVSTPRVRCGCCPVCHEFVRIGPSGQPANAVCPSCGHSIESLDALGVP
jgi:hypothetical protein